MSRKQVVIQEEVEHPRGFSNPLRNRRSVYHISKANFCAVKTITSGTEYPSLEPAGKPFRQGNLLSVGKESRNEVDSMGAVLPMIQAVSIQPGAVPRIQHLAWVRAQQVGVINFTWRSMMESRRLAPWWSWDRCSWSI